MNLKPVHFPLVPFFKAVLAWMVETTEESRSARLSTLGLSALGRSPAWYDESSDVQRLR